MSSDSISKLSDCPPDVSSSPYSSSYELGKDDIDYFLGATLELTISFPSCHESFPVVAAVALVVTFDWAVPLPLACRSIRLACVAVGGGSRMSSSFPAQDSTAAL
jgi:hypothetical protein